jgi:Putative methyltransferase
MWHVVLMEPQHSGNLPPNPAQVDWLAWHADYDDPNSRLSERLAAVQRRITEALDQSPPGPIQVLSICAGQGRDIIDVLASHARRREVAALLVESDGRNVEEARRRAAEAGLGQGVTVLEGDASWTDAYRDAVPANVIICCGVFGNISLSDIESTIKALPGLSAPAAVVIWTRHRRRPDVTTLIRRWMEEAGFLELGFDAPEGYFFAVGSARLNRLPDPFVSGHQLFTFVGDGSRPA